MPGNYSRVGGKLLANASVKQIFNPLALFLILPTEAHYSSYSQGFSISR